MIDHNFELRNYCIITLMNTKSFGRTLFGIAIVAVGVGFMLDSLNIYNFNHIIGDWWPSLIVLAGLASLFSSPRQFLWPLTIVFAGILLQLRQLNVLNFDIWGLIWPAIIIIGGLSLIAQRSGHTKPQTTDDNIVDMFVTFSGLEAKNQSDTFAGGKITALFGGVTLDLLKAKITDKATIDIFTAFGGIELRVPEGWRVKASGLPLFGGWDNKTEMPEDKDAPTLYIRGTCMFGGFEVKN